ncbi:MAG: exopolyphosphatase [Desulfobacterales bacterium]|nr:exopolyphosphatase [Desulfobacterales bacterium]MDD4071141.1 exopolyphosphatase [Desulfobacterales bacterium]MDD4392577.1 exopolyphosphatase [Desulfobacterales bacterium]
MRIVTRPDFDGVVCAVLLYDVEDIRPPIKWVEPNDMQKGLVDIQSGDIIANLPYHYDCSLWFDHHYTNQIARPFNGAFRIAPSAAGVVYGYYLDRFQRNYSKLVRETDKIDSAELTLDEVQYPEKYDYVLLSMTISSHSQEDEAYWNRLVDLLRTYDINFVMKNPEVIARCRSVVEQNRRYKETLKKYTRLNRHVSITDFRMLTETPSGNRFLVYSMFPGSAVNVKIRYDNDNRDKLIVSVGHSIFNRNCKVNAGLLLSGFEGGGHYGAASCSFHASKAEDYVPKILDALLKNEPIK